MSVWCLTTLHSVVCFVFKSIHRITNHFIFHNILRKCHIKWEVNKKGGKERKGMWMWQFSKQKLGFFSTFSSSICQGEVSTSFSTQHCSMNLSNSYTHQLLHFKYLLSYNGISSLKKELFCMTTKASNCCHWEKKLVICLQISFRLSVLHKLCHCISKS